MNFSYYPGCTLKTKAKELDAYARKSAEALGVVMEELEDWQCCGAVYPMAEDEIATKLSAVRALAAAKEGATTSCPNAHEWLQAYGDAEEIFAVAITSNLSGTCSAAMQAADDYLAAHPSKLTLAALRAEKSPR